MIVKGHDFPRVTLVGVLLADLSLNEADYRSSERTFQLVTQAAGRAGRAERPGLALIQTYHPEHYSIQCAAAQDYPGFYKEEMAFRTLMNYPPAGIMASPMLIFSRTAASSAVPASTRKAGRSIISPKIPTSS